MGWQEIWQKKALDAKDKPELEQLIAIDGFDTGAGCFPLHSWISSVAATEEKLNLKKGKRVLEVGCGGGAFLKPLYDKGINVAGIDYSSNMINICQKVMPDGEFRVAEARSLPFADEQFDAVIANSVYQYFPDADYAKESLKEMIRILKAGDIDEKKHTYGCGAN